MGATSSPSHAISRANSAESISSGVASSSPSNAHLSDISTESTRSFTMHHQWSAMPDTSAARTRVRRSLAAKRHRLSNSDLDSPSQSQVAKRRRLNPDSPESSQTQHPSASIRTWSDEELEKLQRLATGDGLTKEEFDTLFDQCGVCDCRVRASALEEHFKRFHGVA